MGLNLLIGGFTALGAGFGAAGAREDEVFARKLSLRPKPVLEEFLGLRIPDHITLTVVLEDETRYGLVIPRRERTAEPAAQPPLGEAGAPDGVPDR